MKVLVLVNGELSTPGILQSRVGAESFDLIIAADGGARHARTLGVDLDVVIGDQDSLPDSAQSGAAGPKYVVYSAQKNETDLELALLYARAKGADRIVMVGALGGRLDMTISNILLMAHEGLSPCRVEVWHGEQTAWVIRPPGGDIDGQPGDTVSLIPLAGHASGVTTEGLKYPLQEAVLTFGPARGISNALVEPPARVRLWDGLLLAVHTPNGE